MCCNRSLNQNINRLHERCLRIINSNKKSSFDEWLDKDEYVSIHIQNIQKLGIEMFKVIKGEKLETGMKFFISGMRPFMNFHKDYIFISLKLMLLSAVQKV